MEDLENCDGVATESGECRGLEGESNRVAEQEVGVAVGQSEQPMADDPDNQMNEWHVEGRYDTVTKRHKGAEGCVAQHLTQKSNLGPVCKEMGLSKFEIFGDQEKHLNQATLLGHIGRAPAVGQKRKIPTKLNSNFKLSKTLCSEEVSVSSLNESYPAPMTEEHAQNFSKGRLKEKARAKGCQLPVVGFEEVTGPVVKELVLVNNENLKAEEAGLTMPPVVK